MWICQTNTATWSVAIHYASDFDIVVTALASTLGARLYCSGIKNKLEVGQGGWVVVTQDFFFGDWGLCPASDHDSTLVCF